MASLQRVHPVTQAPADLDQESVGLGQSADGVSVWMTTEETAIYLRYRGHGRLRSVYRFIKDKGIAVRRRGRRSILIARADVDKALEVASPAQGK
jgi:hypothetical protein